MTHYQLLTKNLPQIIEMIHNGYMKPDIIKHIEIYETYHSLTGNKTGRYNKLSKKFKMHPDSIRKVITKLKNKTK